MSGRINPPAAQGGAPESSGSGGEMAVGCVQVSLPPVHARLDTPFEVALIVLILTLILALHWLQRQASTIQGMLRAQRELLVLLAPPPATDDDSSREPEAEIVVFPAGDRWPS